MSIEKLKERHAEELHDYDEYMKMVEDCHEYGQIFRKIACDEKHHAELIEYIIEHIK